jgi:hypothetical protein
MRRKRGLRDQEKKGERVKDKEQKWPSCPRKRGSIGPMCCGIPACAGMTTVGRSETAKGKVKRGSGAGWGNWGVGPPVLSPVPARFVQGDFVERGRDGAQANPDGTGTALYSRCIRREAKARSFSACSAFRSPFKKSPCLVRTSSFSVNRTSSNPPPKTARTASRFTGLSR